MCGEKMQRLARSVVVGLPWYISPNLSCVDLDSMECHSLSAPAIFFWPRDVSTVFLEHNSEDIVCANFSTDRGGYIEGPPAAIGIQPASPDCCSSDSVFRAFTVCGDHTQTGCVEELGKPCSCSFRVEGCCAVRDRGSADLNMRVS